MKIPVHSPASFDRGRAFRLLVRAAAVLSLEAGCRSAPRPVVREGRTSYEALSTPDVAAAKLVSKREFLAAEPAGDNPPPVYPVELVPLGLPLQKIVLRLEVDERGRVAAVRPSDTPSEVSAPYRSAFEGAVRRAVDGWRFVPARRRTFEDSPDDGSGKPRYRVLKSEAPAPTYFDVRFVFEIRDGKGVVNDAK